MMSTTTQVKTLSEFITELNIKVDECKPINSNPNMPNWTDARHYQVTLINKEGKKFSIPFSMGLGHKLPPTTEDVLDCLALDAMSIWDNKSFKDWKAEFGYEDAYQEDNTQVRNIYRACREQSKQLREWLSVRKYKALLFNVERL